MKEITVNWTKIADRDKYFYFGYGIGSDIRNVFIARY